MARGSLAKVRWRNDRVRKAKARAKRRAEAGRNPAPTAVPDRAPTPAH